MVVEAVGFNVVVVVVLVLGLVRLRRWWWMLSPDAVRNAAEPITAVGVLLALDRLVRSVKELVETLRDLF